MSFISEADRQYAEGYGQDHPEQAWVLSDRDVWYRNPYYNGPAVPHPDDREAPMSFREAVEESKELAKALGCSVKVVRGVDGGWVCV
jgi:hypothetical protein